MLESDLYPNSPTRTTSKDTIGEHVLNCELLPPSYGFIIEQGPGARHSCLW